MALILQFLYAFTPIVVKSASRATIKPFFFKILPFFNNYIRVGWYSIAYIPVGFPVIKEGWKSITNGNFFTEFFFMGIATIGAFAIGEYPGGVAVMVFYAVGELFQGAAVKRAKGNIQALLDSLNPQL